MKDAKKLSDQIPKEHLPLTQLIDNKIDSDMEKVLNKIDAMANILGSDLKSIKSEVSAVEKSLKSEVSAVEKALEGRMDSLKGEVSSATRMFWYFIVAIIAGVVIAVVSKYMGR